MKPMTDVHISVFLTKDDNISSLICIVSSFSVVVCCCLVELK